MLVGKPHKSPLDSHSFPSPCAWCVSCVLLVQVQAHGQRPGGMLQAAVFVWPTTKRQGASIRLFNCLESFYKSASSSFICFWFFSFPFLSTVLFVHPFDTSLWYFVLCISTYTFFFVVFQLLFEYLHRSSIVFIDLFPLFETFTFFLDGTTSLFSFISFCGPFCPKSIHSFP